MSRAAVAKHVAALRELGFELDASPRRGYSLSGWPDRLEPEAVLPLLGTRALGRSYAHLSRCASTNAEAFAAAVLGAPHGHTVTTDQQEAGRGRRGRHWHSPAGAGLYLSVVLRPALPPQQAAPLTLACAVAVAEALEAVAGVSPRVKWPNDLQLGGRKLCGILLEMSAEPERIAFVVAGIGLNANTEDFPEELADLATSLRIATGCAHPRPPLVAGILEALEAWTDRFVSEGPGPVLAAWRRRATLLGQAVTLHGPEGVRHGVAEDIDADGALLLRDAQGELHRVLAGDVSLRGHGPHP